MVSNSIGGAGGVVVPANRAAAIGVAPVSVTRYVPPATVNRDDKLSIFGQLFGSKGEFKVEDLTSDKEICQSIFRNGLWESRSNEIGTFAFQKQAIDIPYLTKDGAPFFALKLPKIPGRLLNATVEFFRAIMMSHSNEVMVQFFWNKTTQEYELYVPNQIVAGASIQFKRDEGPMMDTNLIWALDIHSHVRMSAFFSGTDSADEVSTRMFGVIGQLDKEDYASSWRAGINGKFVAITKEDIFDLADEGTYTIEQELYSRVTTRVTAPYVAPAAVAYGRPGVVQQGNAYHSRANRYLGNDVGDFDGLDYYGHMGVASGYFGSIESSGFDSKPNSSTSWEDAFYAEYTKGLTNARAKSVIGDLSSIVGRCEQYANDISDGGDVENLTEGGMFIKSIIDDILDLRICDNESVLKILFTSVIDGMDQDVVNEFCAEVVH